MEISNQGTKQDEPKAAGNPLAQMGKGGAVLMVCRTCGKNVNHWTSRCPYKDLSVPSESFVDELPASESTTISSNGGKGAYLPPTMCAGAERTSGSDMRRRNDENSVSVNNLSEDRSAQFARTIPSLWSSEPCLQKTGRSRGFGFVNFVRREDADRAIAKLNGYGYDNLILGVEWAAPRSN